MIIDSRFFKILEEESSKPFDWETNNCGQFVGRIYTRVLGRDFLDGLTGHYDSQYTAYRFLVKQGGWDVLLANLGLAKRDLKKISRGDVVIAQNALGIWDGAKGVFAGGGTRNLRQITAAYYLTI